MSDIARLGYRGMILGDKGLQRQINEQGCGIIIIFTHYVNSSITSNCAWYNGTHK